MISFKLISIAESNPDPPREINVVIWKHSRSDPEITIHPRVKSNLEHQVKIAPLKGRWMPMIGSAPALITLERDQLPREKAPSITLGNRSVFVGKHQADKHMYVWYTALNQLCLSNWLPGPSTRHWDDDQPTGVDQISCSWSTFKCVKPRWIEVIRDPEIFFSFLGESRATMLQEAARRASVSDNQSLHPRTPPQDPTCTCASLYPGLIRHLQVVYPNPCDLSLII